MNVSLWVRGLLVAMLVVGVSPAAALALQSPYADSGDPSNPAEGSIKAYDADGNAIDVSYYDRVGDGPLPKIVGDSSTSSVEWSAFYDGPVPTTSYTPIN